MNHNDFIQANRDSWNEAAPFHRSNKEFAALLVGFEKSGFNCLEQIETDWLNLIGVSDKAVAQICCNKGSELLSVKNMGAATCVGFDGAGEFLALGRKLAAAGNLQCEFVETNVYEIPGSYYGQFDVCMITIGVFGWMPDIEGFFKVVSALLKPGGSLFIHEEHPIVNVFEPDTENPLLPVNSYFRQEPFEESEIIVYDGVDQGTGKTHFWFVHPLSAIFTACIDNGLTIRKFEEHPYNISSTQFDIFEEQGVDMPLSYAMIATKQ